MELFRAEIVDYTAHSRQDDGWKSVERSVIVLTMGYRRMYISRRCMRQATEDEPDNDFDRNLGMLT